MSEPSESSGAGPGTSQGVVPAPRRWRARLPSLARSIVDLSAIVYPLALLALVSALRLIGERWWVTTIALYLPRMGLGKSSDPVIIAGDTNLPGLSWAFSHWLGGFSDGFAEAGRGLGYSYPAQRMVWMRIDRILAGPRFRFLDVTTISPPVSNHLAVAAELELIPQSQ